MANKGIQPKPKVVEDPRFKEIEMMFSDLDSETHRMSSWERDEFIPSVSDQFTQRGTLSDNQYNTLKKIWDRLIR